MKRVLALLLVFMMLFAVGCSSNTLPEKKEAETPENTKGKLNVDMVFGTSSSGGTWYTLGMGLANIWNDKLKDSGVRVYAQATGGGQENAQMLDSGEVDICLLGGVLCNYVYNGLNDFKKNDKMRTLTALQAASVQWVVMGEDAKTGGCRDISGMRFALNNPGASAALHYEIISKAIGDLNITSEFLNPASAAEAMKNGNLRGGAFDGGAPTSALLDLYSTANIKVKLLEFTKEDIDAMNKVTPGVWSLGTITADTYGMDKDVTVPQYRDSLVVTVDADEEAVYQILTTIYDNLEEVKAVHSGNKVISLENALVGLSVPLHAGAVRFYKERGIEIPDYLMPPEAK